MNLPGFFLPLLLEMNEQEIGKGRKVLEKGEKAGDGFPQRGGSEIANGPLFPARLLC